jgi:voltage-dependent potassium channel beta subunit
MSSTITELPKMYYRTIGNTGIVTSVFGFGFWATFGVKAGLLDREGIETAKQILSTARAGGINLFDNAEMYGNPIGEAERIFGEAYAELESEDPELWRRSDVVITTKLYWGGKGQNENGLSRKHIMEGMAKSLKRLKLDYVDLIYCHRPDNLTPTETTVRAMTDLVRSGKAAAWGTSEWSAQQITEAFWIARSEGLEPPQVEQPQYHMFHRERFEKEYFPLYSAPYNIGTTIWSPLASGLLTGKYNEGIPEGSRVTQKGYEWLIPVVTQWKEEGKLEKVKKLTEYARDNFDCSVAQLSLAWCVKNKKVSCVLLGATKVDQIEENLKAIPVAAKLTEKHMEDIDKILGNKPESYWGMSARKVSDL